jgi:hypothetical protein
MATEGMTGLRFRWRLVRAAFQRHPSKHGCSWEFLAYSNMRYADALVAKMEKAERGVFDE